MVREYTSKIPVKAIPLTWETLNKVESFLRTGARYRMVFLDDVTKGILPTKDISHTVGIILIDENGVNTLVEQGDYIIKNSLGKFYCLTEKEFMSTFEKAELLHKEKESIKNEGILKGIGFMLFSYLLLVYILIPYFGW